MAMPRHVKLAPAVGHDAIFGHGSKHQPLFYDYQAQTDTAANAWGGRSMPPMWGEQLLNYRRRLLRPT
jgi:hypothetical protein